MCGRRGEVLGSGGEDEDEDEGLGGDRGWGF